jgi:hypothetical protein
MEDPCVMCDSFSMASDWCVFGEGCKKQEKREHKRIKVLCDAY